jgi:hypothetical protein
MKKILFFICILSIVLSACDLAVTIAPSVNPTSLPANTTIPVTVIPTQITDAAAPTPEVFIALTQAIPPTIAIAPDPTATQAPVSPDGVEVAVDPLRIVLSHWLASGARGEQFSRTEGEGVAPWDATPGHTRLTLEGYILQGKFHQPQIYIYPALGYAEMRPAAFESIHRLNNILYDPSAPISKEQLPTVPFFNAQQVFASNVQVISFQNGQGVRFLTEYAQYPASANNADLFYHFQGVTSDGTYYVVAILPITAPMLAETSDGGAPLPAGGVPYPYFADPNADMLGYYSTVTALLNGIPPEGFYPTINQLDALIQSMRITP